MNLQLRRTGGEGLAAGAVAAKQTWSPVRQQVTLAKPEPVAQGESLGPFLAEHANDSESEVEFFVQRYLINPDGDIEWFEPVVETLGPGETALNIYFIDVPLSYREGEYTAGLVLTDEQGYEIRDDAFRVTIELPTYANTLGMTFKLIPGGTFAMGTRDQKEVGMDDAGYFYAKFGYRGRWCPLGVTSLWTVLNVFLHVSIGMVLALSPDDVDAATRRAGKLCG